MNADRRLFIATGAVMALAGLSGCTTSFLSLGDRNDTGADRVVTREALARINAFRVENGRSRLRADRAASDAALDHARRMAASGTMAHNIGFGADFARRMRRQGVELPAAENIATGQAEIDRALLAWEVSQSHRTNTLDPRFTGVGVAVAYANGTPYWAMILSGG